MINLRFVIIDEAIHINDEIACELWQKTLWAKELGYREHYNNSILPMGTDDFFGTHLIVATELPTGKLDPVVMYKSVRRSQYERFHVPFGGLSLLNGTTYENSIEVHRLLKEAPDISYDSSWTINPKYKSIPGISGVLRDHMTAIGLLYHQTSPTYRWLTAGVKQFKIDQYFEWLGCSELLPEFALSIIDNQKVRMLYMRDTREIPEGPRQVLKDFAQKWSQRIVFAPKDSALLKVA